MRQNIAMKTEGERPRIALYSHDTLGYGHLRRNIMLAKRLRQLPAQPDILLIAGMREAGSFSLPDGIDLVTLPAYAKQSDGQYAPRHLAMPLRSLSKMREATICAAVSAFDPHLFVVDNVPRGAQYELDATLRTLRETRRTHVVLGLRDVIDEREKVRNQWVKHRNFSTVNELFDEVWIYGSPDIYDLVHEYEMGDAFRQKARFTGYLRRDHPVDSSVVETIRAQILQDDDSPYILAMVGGGRDGASLCKAFVQSRLPKGRRGILITGSQMSPPDAGMIAELARANSAITVVDFLSETIALIDGAERVIGMGGYNSVCEVISMNKHALIVPRARPRAEQLIRAERLNSMGLIDMLHPDQVTPDSLSDWMHSPRKLSNHPLQIGMDGLENVALFASQALAPKPPLQTIAESRF